MKLKYLFLLSFITTGLFACISQNTPDTLTATTVTEKPESCLPPIETFIYENNPDHSQPIPGQTLVVAPQSPWGLVAELPPSKVPGASPILSRTVGGDVEIWVTQPTGDDLWSTLLVFRTNTKEWKNISSKIGNSSISVGILFTIADGSLWGVAGPMVNGPLFGRDKPALAKYNESDETFEFVPSTATISAARKDIDFIIPYWSIVLKDNNDVFWILVHNDGIYSFDPVTNIVRMQADLQNKVIRDAVISPSGEIYYILDVDTYGQLSINQTPLYKFDPTTGKTEYVSIDLEPWPLYGHPFVDLQGRLWLGNLGFLDRDQNWYLLEKSNLFLANTLEASEEMRWRAAIPLLQSSDGRLWFRSVNGTFWLNLEDQKWCWFTTYQSNIVEDSDHNLWMIADNKLYKLSLEGK